MSRPDRGARKRRTGKRTTREPKVTPAVGDYITCRHCGSRRLRFQETSVVAGEASLVFQLDGSAVAGPSDDEPSVSAIFVCRDCTLCTGLTVVQAEGEIAFTIARLDPPPGAVLAN